MKKYEVTAPYVVFATKEAGKEPKEYSLKRGDTVELPEGDIAVRAMVARKQLKEVETPTTEKAAKK